MKIAAGLFAPAVLALAACGHAESTRGSNAAAGESTTGHGSSSETADSSATEAAPPGRPRREDAEYYGGDPATVSTDTLTADAGDDEPAEAGPER